MAQKNYNYKFIAPNYGEQEKKCKTFLENFEDKNIEEHPIHGHKKYMIQMVFYFICFLIKFIMIK